MIKLFFFTLLLNAHFEGRNFIDYIHYHRTIGRLCQLSQLYTLPKDQEILVYLLYNKWAMVL